MDSFSFGLLFAIVLGFLALDKGYTPLRWIFAGGFIGLILLIVLPNVTERGIHPEAERTRLRNRGDTVGLVLSILSILVAVFVALLAASADV